MSEDLDTTSTDAMHWSKQLVKTATEQGFTLEQVLDDSWLVGWFANYWAAIHDPLVNERDQLRKEKAELEAQVLYWKVRWQQAATRTILPASEVASGEFHHSPSCACPQCNPGR